MRIKAEDTNRDLDHSRPFDVHTWSKHPYVNMFVNEIHDQYDLAESNIGKHNLKKVLIDLYLAWADDPELIIGFHRNHNQYSTGKRLNKLKIGKKTPAIIDKLSELGLIDDVNGYYGYDRDGDGKTRSRISRMWPTLKLIDHFKKADLSRFYYTDGCYSAITVPESLSNAVTAAPEFREVEDRECIILKEKNPDKKSPIKQLPIEYNDNRNTKRMRTELMEYNRLLVRSHIDLGSLDGPYVEIRDEKRFQDNEKGLMEEWRIGKLIKRIPVNQSIKFTTRQFANSSWKQGGRFYGGWWQQLPSEHRPDIRIDNTPTTEIDYSGHHPVLLYAEAGINYWSEVGGDVYDIPKVDFFPSVSGWSRKKKKDSNRLCLKLLLMMLINAESEQLAFSAFRKRIIDDYPEWKNGGVARPIRWDEQHLYLIAQRIKEKHSPIRKKFGSGAGVKLQYVDSAITEKLLKHFTDRGVVVLPIHDSYVVQEQYGEELRYVMEQLWREQIAASGASPTAFDPVFNDHDDVRPKLKQIGYYDELYDHTEEGGGEAHKAIRRQKDNTKLSKRYREHWTEWREFSAEQGWS
jgi:hypothetical protein